MAKRGNAERPQGSPLEARARALWPALPTPDVIRGYKGQKQEPASKLGVEVLARLSAKMQKTQADIDGRGGSADLLSMYPDVAELWPHFHFLTDRGGRKAEVVHEQERMQQDIRRQVFEKAVAEGRHNENIATITSDYAAKYNAEHGRRSFGLEFHAREVAQIINDIADGKPNPYADLTARGTNAFEHLRLDKEVSGMLKRILAHSNLPGLQGLFDVLTLQDSSPDTPDYVQHATARIRGIFQDGRAALIRREVVKEHHEAELSADMHGHPGREKLLQELRGDLRVGSAAITTALVYKQLQHLINRVPIPELEEHPEIQNTIEIAMAFLVERVAQAAGKVGLTLLEELVSGHNSDRAKVASMQLIVDLLHPYIGLNTNEEAIARHTLGQFAINPDHTQEFTALYRPVAKEAAFATLEGQDKKHIQILTAEAITETRLAEIEQHAAVRAQEAERKAQKRRGKSRNK